MKKFINALQENSKTKVSKQISNEEMCSVRQKLFYDALGSRGIKSMNELKIDDLDRVYILFKQLEYVGVIKDYTLTDICNAMMGFGLDRLLDECKYGKEIWLTADKLYDSL